MGRSKGRFLCLELRLVDQGGESSLFSYSEGMKRTSGSILQSQKQVEPCLGLDSTAEEVSTNMIFLFFVDR